MHTGMARITYLYNSGFAVETFGQLLIFDYCLTVPISDEKRLISGVVGHEDLTGKTSVTVLVSHGHRDHFNAAILRWRVKHKNISYVFSDDIPADGSAVLMGAGETITTSEVQIRTFPSTDIGVSFLVEADGLSIFHAGDLNLWHPKVESTEEEASYNFKKAKYAFLKALEPLRGHSIDIAFFPVDPRIGPGYDAGALYFAQCFKPKLFVPMHFGENYEVCRCFSTKVNALGMKVLHIEARGQQFEYHKGEV